jgi:hypothetical protein
MCPPAAVLMFFLSSISSCSKNPISEAQNLSKMHAHGRLLLHCFVLTSVLVTPTLADCYWPDNSVNYDHDPCGDRLTEGSLCCRSGDACLLNGLCLDTNNGNTVYYRGSCEFPDWSQYPGQCPMFCIQNGTGINLGGETQVFMCPNGDGTWYCDDDNAKYANCTASQGVFTLSG